MPDGIDLDFDSADFARSLVSRDGPEPLVWAYWASLSRRVKPWTRPTPI